MTLNFSLKTLFAKRILWPVLAMAVLIAAVFVLLVWQKPALLPPLESPAKIEAWASADDFISPPPEPVSAQEFYQLFLEARKAIEENNQEAMREKLSRQLLWQSENPLRYLGANEEGVVINSRRDISQASYFQEFLIFSPAPDQVTPLEVIPSEGKTTAASQVILVKNEATDKTERVVITPWRYLARLKVQRSDDGPKQGYVIFVYDRGAWRYHAENWLGR